MMKSSSLNDELQSNDIQKQRKDAKTSKKARKMMKNYQR